MTEVGVAAAFIAGVLALFSPCSALLLPSFFAYAALSSRDLGLRTVVFYLGMLLALVPLGVGVAAASTLFYGHRELLVRVVGWALMTFGALLLLGRGLTVPGAAQLAALTQRRRAGSAGWVGILLLGASTGLAGLCSGPILGAVLTLAASSGHTAYGAALLAIYALGMALPLFVLALLWDRFGLGERLRPHLRWSSILAGVLLVGAGALFLLTNGTASLAGTTPQWVSTTQDNLLTLVNGFPVWVWPTVVAVLAAGVAWRRVSR